MTTISEDTKHCGCMASISPADPRSDIWLYAFGKLEFPIKYPIADIGFKQDPSIKCYPGLASALTDSQKDKLIEKMAENFGVSRTEVELGFKENIIPIKDTGVIVSWCKTHFYNLLPNEFEDPFLENDFYDNDPDEYPYDDAYFEEERFYD